MTDTDTGRVTVVGLYDAFLGGTEHTDADEDAVDVLKDVLPDVAQIAWANRGFHNRAAKWVAERGIRQFVDTGPGLVAQNTAHQVVQRVAPDARYVYVELGEDTVARGTEAVADDPNTAYVEAHPCQPGAVLEHPGLRELVDLREPVALLSTALVSFMSPERDPWGVVDGYLRRFVPGSYLALSQLTGERMAGRKLQAVYDIYRLTGEMVYFRNQNEIEWFFRDLELVPPYEGAYPQLTFAGLWGCEDPVAADDDAGRWLYVGVGRVP